MSATSLHNRFPRTPSQLAKRRWISYSLVQSLLSIVSDGWSGKPSPLVHQISLLPFAGVLSYVAYRLLAPEQVDCDQERLAFELPSLWWVWLVIFELLSIGMMVAEASHFKKFGYRLTVGACMGGLLCSVMAWTSFAFARRGTTLFFAVLFTYAAGLAVAIRCFPLNYLRSDMLPVISWASDRLARHLDPYQTMHVGARLYDFPYLPGMLVAFLPAQVLHVDLRFATFLYLAAAVGLIFTSARRDRRFEIAALLGLFLLCPFLQYRHDLYLEPHWFTLVLAVVLMNRRLFGWSAVVWGLSCGVYQLSWVLIPFFLLNALWRGGMWEVCKLTGLNLLGGLLVAGPFLRSATHQITNNTVAQWSYLPHALADPINASFWLTYFIRPDQLKWVQAIVLTGLFAYCLLARRCKTLVDTVRWMSCALAVFIPMNVLVDGYFYLTLSMLLLLYVCLANDWWSKPLAEPVDAVT